MTSDRPTRRTRVPTSVRLPLQRTLLRDLNADDAEILVPLFADADVQRFTPGAPRTSQGFRQFVGRARHRRRTGGHLCLAIEFERRAIGIIQVWPLVGQATMMEFGFALGRPYRGQGLLYEAATGFVTWAFSELAVDRLEARTALSNSRAIAALMRMGARPEGILRQCLADAEQHTDGILWSILATEWAPGEQREEPVGTGLTLAFLQPVVAGPSLRACNQTSDLIRFGKVE